MIAGAALLVLLCGVAIGATSIGGVLVVPVLTALADVPARQAVAAASFAFAFTGVAAFARREESSGGSLVLDGSALGGAALGALTLAWIPAEGVRWTVGLLAVASGLWALLGRFRDGAAALPALTLATLGIAVGCVSAWSGTGGPVVLLPLAALLGWHGVTAVHAAQRIQLPVALAASAVNLAAGRLDLALGCAVGIVVLIGWGAGRWVARRMPVRRLQQAVAVALVAAGLSYLWTEMETESMEDPRTLQRALAADAMLLAPEWTLQPDGPARDLGVVVIDGRFEAIGPLADVARQHPHLKQIDLPQHLLMPGFVDAHHHLTQSFGKALAFGEPSEIFRRIWVPLESSLDAESLYLSAKLAALEALRGGFTTVCDAGTRAAEGLDAVAAATRDAGVRCVLGRICNDDGSRHAEVLAEAERFLGGSTSLLHPSLAVSIPEVATDAMLHAASRLCAEAGAVFQVHVNEHLAAVERSLVARGLRPLQHLGGAGALGPQALLAHCTMLVPDEMLLLRDSGCAVAINPVASQWKGNAVAPTGLLAALKVRLGLGTDGTRSDAFRMMDAGEANQRIAFGLADGDSSCGGGHFWLDLATRGGANAAGLGRVTGSVEVGKAADFLLVDLDVPELTPSWDLRWELVRLASREQIASVHVGGRLRLWHGWPVDWDARALLAEVRRIARDSVARAPIHKVHPGSDFSAGSR